MEREREARGTAGPVGKAGPVGEVRAAVFALPWRGLAGRRAVGRPPGGGARGAS